MLLIVGYTLAGCTLRQGGAVDRKGLLCGRWLSERSICHSVNRSRRHSGADWLANGRGKGMKAAPCMHHPTAMVGCGGVSTLDTINQSEMRAALLAMRTGNDEPTMHTRIHAAQATEG